MIQNAINQALQRNRAFKASVKSVRNNVIAWGVALPGTTTGLANIQTTWIWTSADGIYKVGFGKYGKEYYSSNIKWQNGTVGNNPSDMRPTVSKNGQILSFDGSFDHVFTFFQQVQKAAGDSTLETIGELMFRNAYLLDHTPSPATGDYHFNPNSNVIAAITAAFPCYDGISTEAYLHYIDAIAQNEDTKYSTLGYDVNQGTGRTNNMLTYAHIIAVLLGKASLSKLCAGFSRPPVGVSPITYATAQQAFPDLQLL
jgi:hypothetical protein